MKFSVYKSLLLFIALVSLSACKNSTSTEVSDSNSDYYPGQIVVEFVDTVSYNFAVNFCHSVNLGIINLEFDHDFWAKADSNNLDYYRKMFSKDSTVVYIDKLYSGSSADTLLITISFNGINTIEYDLEKIKSVGLNVYEINNHPKGALLKTPIGLERLWIYRLTHYEFIKYAELNTIIHAL